MSPESVPPCPPPLPLLRSGLLTPTTSWRQVPHRAPGPGGPILLHKADLMGPNSAPQPPMPSCWGCRRLYQLPLLLLPTPPQNTGDPLAMGTHFQLEPDHPGSTALPGRPFPSCPSPSLATWQLLFILWDSALVPPFPGQHLRSPPVLPFIPPPPYATTSLCTHVTFL